MKTLGLPHPAHIEALERYEPGKPIEEVQRELGLRRVVKLASNENPLGPSPAALAGAHTALTAAHRYPDGPGGALRQALARRHQLEPGQVVLGNGSTDLIDLLARAYLAPGDNAVIAEQAFARFRQCVNARNGGARLVPMRAHTHDLEAMAAAVDARTRLVFVANPNNPTGTWNTRAQVEAFLERLPGDVLVVLDEAYFEYAESGALYPNGLDYVRAGAPVVVLRTFSKVYGLAGLRVGYALGAREVALALDTVREPFNTNLVGQAAALAALEDQGHLVRSLELNRVEKARLEQALAARGLRVLPSLANFLCVEVGDGAAAFQKLLARGVIVRPLRPYGLEAWLRISVGNADENDTLLEAIDAVVLPARS